MVKKNGLVGFGSNTFDIRKLATYRLRRPTRMTCTVAGWLGLRWLWFGLSTALNWFCFSRSEFSRIGYDLIKSATRCLTLYLGSAPIFVSVSGQENHFIGISSIFRDRILRVHTALQVWVSAKFHTFCIGNSNGWLHGCAAHQENKRAMVLQTCVPLKRLNITSITYVAMSFRPLPQFR